MCDLTLQPNNLQKEFKRKFNCDILNMAHTDQLSFIYSTTDVIDSIIVPL